MTTKEQIKQILVDYTKKNGISASVVILEDYADELIKHGVTLPVRCKDCAHYVEFPGMTFKGRTAKHCIWHSAARYEDDYCSAGIRRTENGN